MDQEKIGKLIKELREKSSMTQREFAEKYGVSFQAVSKWERGLNIPDISLLKEICRDYQISLEELLIGNLKMNKEGKKYPVWVFILLFFLVVILVWFLINKPKSYQFKTLSSTCNAFKVSGSLAYDKSKSSIYISSIDYCGGDDETTYEKIECDLYENGDNRISKISSCEAKEHITLEEYLKHVEIENSSYSSSCKNYDDNSLYLEIHAYGKDYKSTVYKIPLSLNSTCSD